ncbi:MAG: N-acetylmuramoyl-L-alanine amidase [Bdellovibrionales bacterium]
MRGALLITPAPSPNFDKRDPLVPLRYVVLHYTGMKSGEEALARLRDPAAKVSAHYLIEEDGRVFALVEESARTWHAGKSFWRGVTDLNSASIGIELVNPGHEFGYRAFSKPQIASLVPLVQDIVARHRLDPRQALLAHSDIAPQRKQDPGELFPWRELAEQGLGVWPAPAASSQPATCAETQNLLRGVGYDCPNSHVYDDPTRAALMAFQRRFDPQNLTGMPEPQTTAMLRAVTRML